MKKQQLALIAGLTLAFSAGITQAQDSSEQPEMGFFVTSAGTGMGGDLGGLAGADAHCQSLAEDAGSEGKTWRAYLSTQAADGKPAINARDRIGDGPWYNSIGELIASSVDDLHYNNANINYKSALNENGKSIASGGYRAPVNEHDILTGSNMDGTAVTDTEDATCHNWTSSNEGQAIVGHHDRYRFTTHGSSWNSVHKTSGCSQAKLESTGGAGMFYCFAID